MRRWMLYNIVTTLALAAVVIWLWISQHPISFALYLVLALAYCLLAAANLLSPIFLWRKHRRRAFIPLATFGLCLAFMAITLPTASRAITHGSPRDPDSFMTDERKTELAKIAEELLLNSYKGVRIFPQQSTVVEMIAGHKPKALPSGIREKLNAHGFHTIYIDDTQSLVVFEHYYFRSWYEYLYTPEEFPPLFKRPVSFTEVDIEVWQELIDILRQGPDATPTERQSIVFEPAVAYPYLKESLGDAVVARIQSYRSEFDITADEKATVLAALNTLRLADSRFADHPSITFNPTGDFLGRAAINFRDGIEISSSFWVTTLTEQLIAQGTLTLTPDNHLKIKDNLSDDDRLSIEWVHVGLIEHSYGNLLSKRENAYERSLGDGWYFNTP